MASKRAIRRRACEGKIRHTSRDAALAYMHWSIRRFRPPSALNVYPCKFCRGWHIGHKPRPKRRRHL